MTEHTPIAVTWTPVHPALPDWRSFWTSANTNQILIRSIRDADGLRITHLLVLGHDIRTADLQAIPLGRIIQMINANTPPNRVAPRPNGNLTLPDGTVITDDDHLLGYLQWLASQTDDESATTTDWTDQ